MKRKSKSQRNAPKRSRGITGRNVKRARRKAKTVRGKPRERKKAVRRRKPFAGVFANGTQPVYRKIKRANLVAKIRDLRKRLGVEV